MANAKTDHLTVKVSRELVPRGFTWQRLPRDAVQADALGLLALVAGQDVEPAEGSDGTGGRRRIARKVAPGHVISTVDPQARQTRKSKSWRRDGFRGHVAAELETGLVTGCEIDDGRRAGQHRCGERGEDGRP
jgi:hypothetical protein